MSEEIKKIYDLSKIPMTDDSETKRVEIIMLKFKEEWKVIGETIGRIIEYTQHPYKLNIFDNRLNSANTSRIWNKLINESTCDYVLVIDSDAYVQTSDPCWLTRMMESIDETGIVVPVVDNAGGCNKALHAKEYGTSIMSKGVWAGMCFLIKKSILEETGMFDENFYIYGQDSEFAFRAGKKVGTVIREDVWVHHIGGYSFDKDPLKPADKLYARHLFLKLTGQIV